MAERPNVTASNTVVRVKPDRGFKSLSRRTHEVHQQFQRPKGSPVGLSFRKTIKLCRNTRLNVSKSGISASRKAGPITINSRGKVTIRLGKGLTWRL